MNHLLTDDHSELDALLEKLFATIETADIERIYETLDFFWARLAMHIRAEHLHLFPATIEAIEKSPAGIKNNRVPSLIEARAAIGELQEDHNFFMRALLALIKKMRDLRDNKTIADCRQQILDVRETLIFVKRRLETHNETEETKVYKWVELLLSSLERNALNELMQREITNLPPRFEKIYAE